MKVRKTMCATCPFRKGSPHAKLAPMLAEKGMEEGRICHSTGNSVFYGKTGKPALHCRGVRDIQMQYMAAIGVIDAPTDEAWDRKWAEMQTTFEPGERTGAMKRLAQ